MKKLAAWILALSMIFTLCGCASSDYKKAVALFDEGQYDEAEVAFEALGDYKDSADYLDKIQIEKNKLGVELIKGYFFAFENVKISCDSITPEEITFSGTVGEDRYEVHGRVALQENIMEHTIRLPKHSVDDLDTMDVRHLYWVHVNYEQAYLSELSLLIDILDYSEAMGKMSDAKVNSDFLTDAWRALFDSRSSEQVFMGWSYKMTVFEDSAYYEISAKYVG